VPWNPTAIGSGPRFNVPAADGLTTLTCTITEDTPELGTPTSPAT